MRLRTAALLLVLAVAGALLLAVAGAGAGDVSAASADMGRWATFAQPGYAPADDEVSVGNDKLVVILALRQRNLAFLEERARAVSDPLQPDYGMYFSRDEVNNMAGPAEEDVRIVKEFFEGTEGTVKFSKGRDLVRFVCSARCIEKTFGTKLEMQKSLAKPGTSPYRSASPIKLPEHVAAALDGVSLNAPIFMPKRPKQPTFPPWRYPAVHDMPVINPNLISGDQFLSLKFIVYCKDGKANQDMLDDGVCSSHGTEIVSIEILVLQHPMMQKVLVLPAIKDVLGQSVGDCGPGGSCVEFNATVGSIQNYASTTARIRAHFSDGSVSAFSDPSKIGSVFLLPYTTPAMLSKFYGIPMGEPVRNPRNIISVAEFGGQYYNPKDLEAFFKLMGVRSWDGEGRTQPQLIGPDKPVAGSVFGGEAQLDLQYIMALAPNVSTWFWSVPGTELATTQEPFLDWLMQVADTDDDKVPLVHSVSYGDDSTTMPAWFKNRVNQEFMKLALRGISILIAAGDDGASGARVRLDPTACQQSNPEFPAESPWVTAVGGTQLARAGTPVCQYSTDTVIVSCQDEREVVCSSSKGGGVTTGGGFSNDFERPWYQSGMNGVVAKYLRQSDSPVPDVDKWFYNTSGRAYPDISGISSNYLVWMGDHLEPTSGTSASTPLLAAMITRLNEDRLQQGMPPLGFINPLLYRLAERHPEVFNDVVIGDNRCSVKACCETGFGAARGWDAATGHGSLNMPALRKLLRRGAVEEFALHPDLRFLVATPVPRATMLHSLLLAVPVVTAGVALLGLATFAVLQRRARSVRELFSSTSSLRAPLF
mmetsp:Transcript_171621/g.550080  ORF Transcript_171621/g.550080 Transcript_171621/m.550080 type:complete len:819 (+) Transcript_171621:70-2526(+)